MLPFFVRFCVYFDLGLHLRLLFGVTFFCEFGVTFGVTFLILGGVKRIGKSTLHPCFWLFFGL